MRRTRHLVALLLAAAFALGVGASEARPAARGQVTVTMFAQSTYEPGWNVLIANFERVYPKITVNITYAPASELDQLEVTELAAGNAPDLLATTPGCGQSISVCELAPAGDLAPMIKAPWVKRSLPLVTSVSKYGQGLFTFEPVVSPEGMFTNDTLFGKLGLKVPQTFSQLLDVCQGAKADGTAAVILPGASAVVVGSLIVDLAVATVYGQGPHFLGQMKAGKVSFDGTPGWQQALQEFIDMNNAGCFQPGATGTSGASADAEFAQGQGLMLPNVSTVKGPIDADDPQFTYSFYPFPGGAAPNQTRTYLNLSSSVAVNARSSPANQAAAQTFVEFVARPKQDGLFAQLSGGLTQYEFLKGEIPDYMSSLATAFSKHEYVVNPEQSWWNASVGSALFQNAIGLLTGQSTIDGILQAMDAAWQQGPS